MKAKNNIIQKYATLSILVVYVFFTLVYIFNLPPIVHSVNRLGSGSTTTFISNTNSPGMAGTLLHRGIRTTIENKNKVVVPATTTCLIFFLFILGGLTLLNLTKKANRHYNAFYSPHLDTWLALRTIRI